MSILTVIQNSGYTAPPTGGEVLDLGILDTEENIPPKPPSVWRLPTHIRLGVQLVPQWAPEDRELEYIEDGVTKGVIPALHSDGYKPESRSLVQGGVVQSIQLKYRGYAELIYGDQEKERVYGEHWNSGILHLEAGDLLYTKPFAILPPGRCSYTAVRHGMHWHVTPPGATDHFPRFALGGYYKPYAKVEDMEQLYVTMDQADGRTVAHAERSSAFASRYGLYPPAPIPTGISHIVFVHPADPLQQLSMAEAITKDHVPLLIQVGDITHHFTSLSYETIAPSCLEVLFQFQRTQNP